jgi:hypothetical protein
LSVTREQEERNGFHCVLAVGASLVFTAFIVRQPPRRKENDCIPDMRVAEVLSDFVLALRVFLSTESITSIEKLFSFPSSVCSVWWRAGKIFSCENAPRFM